MCLQLVGGVLQTSGIALFFHESFFITYDLYGEVWWQVASMLDCHLRVQPGRGLNATAEGN